MHKLPQGPKHIPRLRRGWNRVLAPCQDVNKAVHLSLQEHRLWGWRPAQVGLTVVTKSRTRRHRQSHSDFVIGSPDAKSKRSLLTVDGSLGNLLCSRHAIAL